MDYVKPPDVAAAMVEAACRKLALGPRDLLIRGALSGAVLGVATSLAVTAVLATGQPLAGALVFPIGLAVIVLLGLELVTGSFGLLPLPWLEGRATAGAVGANWAWVFLGNLSGSLAFAALLVVVLTSAGTVEPTGIASPLAAIAEAKTLAYAEQGAAGMVTVVTKAVLCNWLVCLAVVLSMTTGSTLGKVVTAWLPIFTFVALGFEHAVVNMFVIPTGMLLGAGVTLADWWAWNQVPVTLGNLVGGFVFTGLALHATYGPSRSRPLAALPARTAPESMASSPAGRGGRA